MTRFARAKGSKSCNEKTPDDGTPWEVMKEQLMQAKQQTGEAGKREEAEKKRIENYENFLKEQKTQKRKATWCEFEETKKISNNSNVSPSKKKKSKHNNPNTELKPKNVEAATNENSNKKKEKQTSQKVQVSEQNDQINSPVNIISKKNKKNKLNGQGPNISEEMQTEQSSISTDPTPKKNKKKNKQNSQEQVSEENQSKQLNVSTDTPISKKNKKKKDKLNSLQENENTPQIPKEKNQSNFPKPMPKKKKFLDGKPVRRKAIDDQSFQIIINGKEVELVRYDGFPVMKKDAERLQELRTNMIKKGIPKSEVQRTMKLERRRAEKALARVKREVCYNCRKGGHNLSDCPELKSKIPGVDAGDGICFKCGSTEHKQFECKVQRDQEFRFATCFICKDQGHIARQCPDNPKGLYPNGGCCKLCGDVTHLKKDCPTMNNTKEETSFKLQTLDSTGNIEEETMQKQTTHVADTFKKPKKITF